jgi:hypothetical protein
MIVRITQLDGKLPNLALMKLAHWHKAKGDEVWFKQTATRDLFEPSSYDIVYGSSVFKDSEPKRQTFKREFPDAIVGGTGYGTSVTVEEIIGDIYEHYDYSIRPEYPFSIGFTQRGCRSRARSVSCLRRKVAAVRRERNRRHLARSWPSEEGPPAR